MSGFKWTRKRTEAAFLLAEGYTRLQTAERVKVAERTIYRWWADLEFQTEVDRLTHMVGIATRAERLRIAMRAVRQSANEAGVKTNRDILDWLKFAQGETDGVKLDLTAIADALSQVADGGQAGIPGEEAPEPSGETGEGKAPGGA